MSVASLPLRRLLGPSGKMALRAQVAVRDGAKARAARRRRMSGRYDLREQGEAEQKTSEKCERHNRAGLRR